MALSEDQKAMLRLLAQREQGYDDLAALMGLSVEEVRAKVKDALDQLEAEGKEAPAVPPPAPEPAAPEVPGSEPAASEAEAPAPAPEPEAKPAPARPEAEAEPAKAAAPPPPGKASGARPKLGLPKDRGARAALGLGLLAVLALVVVLIVSGGDSGESGSSSAASAAGGASTTAAENGESELTEAILAPVDGGDAEGRAIFGRVKKNLALQVEATGLEPSPPGSSYTIWLYKSPKLALRVGAVNVGKSGNLAVQLPVPTELLAYVASGAFDQVDVALTENAAYAAEIARSKKAKQLPAHTGESILRGKIEGPAVR